MIILDTNVVSEIMLPKPDIRVVRWIDDQSATSHWITSITIYELRFGLLSMPPGKKRSDLAALFGRWVSRVIEQRIISFDHVAAGFAAELAAEGKAKGRPREHRDTMIAGIVLANHATLATRNVKHFEDIAKSVVNPWNE